MATSQAAAPSGTAAAAIGETIVGSHLLKIDGFSATKDLGVGKSIKSSTFNVGGHTWYIECYPCGDNEDCTGSVSLFLCLSSVPKEQIEAQCAFTPMGDDGADLEGCGNSYRHLHFYNAHDNTAGGSGIDLMERAKLESLLRNDCFQIRCDVSIFRMFPAVPPPDLHQPLSNLVASGMPGDLTFQVGGELFTVHRGLPGPSAHAAASPTPSGASDSTTGRLSSGSHVLTIDGYSKTKKMFRPNDSIESECFAVGGRRWYIKLYPSREKEDDDTGFLAVFFHNYAYKDKVLKVRFELTLLTLAREIISSAQFCYAFSYTNDSCRCSFPLDGEIEPLLGDSFHVKCDVTVVKEITPMRPPDLHLHFGNLLASQVGTDVTFEVGGDLFSAHKCVLATRSTAFMAEFFGLAGKGSSTTVTRVRIDDIEPGVFKALLHFIYTDTVPEVREDDDKIRMAQGLLVAADRYAMERLKLICGDMLCTYVNDARMAVDTLELADKHGCRRLKEKCIRLLKGHFAKVAP